MKVFIKFLLIGTVALLVAACDKDTGVADEPGGQQETAVEHAQKHLDPTYVCPMHPNIVRDKPGTCPICGMDLVLKEAEQGGAGPEVTISPAVEQNMGVRTFEATRDTLWRKINTVGYVDFNEDKIAHIHLRTEGWIERLMVKSAGERVSKGDLLFELYSPDLVNAQEELIQALNTGNRQLIRASRERLQALGVSDDQIERLQKTRRVQQYVKIFAPQDGIVGELNVRQGMFVTPKIEIMSLADLSSVWLLAEVFERQADWVEVGQPAEVTLSYLPGKVWEGEVEFVYPSLNPKTRTLKARLRFDNPKEELKPNMFADVAIYAGPKRDVVVIPREALIRTGEDQRVIIARGEGRFAPRQVVAGIEAGDWVEIQRGIEAGERVVTSGQFLIDSEASLKASLQRMQSPDTNEKSMPMDSAMDTKTSAVTGSGVLRAIDADANKINMTHDPIPALDWPQMTMDFRVREGVALEPFSVDDAVEFELEKSDSGYVITEMRKAGR